MDETNNDGLGVYINDFFHRFFGHLPEVLDEYGRGPEALIDRGDPVPFIPVPDPDSGSETTPTSAVDDTTPVEDGDGGETGGYGPEGAGTSGFDGVGTGQEQGFNAPENFDLAGSVVTGMSLGLGTVAGLPGFLGNIDTMLAVQDKPSVTGAGKGITSSITSAINEALGFNTLSPAERSISMSAMGADVGLGMGEHESLGFSPGFGIGGFGDPGNYGAAGLDGINTITGLMDDPQAHMSYDPSLDPDNPSFDPESFADAVDPGYGYGVGPNGLGPAGHGELGLGPGNEGSEEAGAGGYNTGNENNDQFSNTPGDSGDTGGGGGSSGSGNAGPSSAPGAPDDIGDSGDVGGEGSGGSSKVVCTAMAAMRGHGTYRNNMWMQYADKFPYHPYITPGYHKIFGPLSEKMATNKVINKVCSYLARVRTIAVRRKLRGKRMPVMAYIHGAIYMPIMFVAGALVKHGILKPYEIKRR